MTLSLEKIKDQFACDRCKNCGDMMFPYEGPSFCSACARDRYDYQGEAHHEE